MPKDSSFVCYYLLQSKFDENASSQRKQQWIDSCVQSLEPANQAFNLFQHLGGGPNGAEWNPMADLFVFAQCKGNFEKAKATIRINNRLDKKTILVSHFCETKQNTTFYCIIPRKRWEQALRAINSSDYEALFGTNNTDSLQQLLSAPPDVATIVEIKLIIAKNKKTHEFTGYFMAAFGE